MDLRHPMSVVGRIEVPCVVRRAHGIRRLCGLCARCRGRTRGGWRPRWNRPSSALRLLLGLGSIQLLRGVLAQDARADRHAVGGHHLRHRVPRVSFVDHLADLGREGSYERGRSEPTRGFGRGRGRVESPRDGIQRLLRVLESFRGHSDTFNRGMRIHGTPPGGDIAPTGPRVACTWSFFSTGHSDSEDGRERHALAIVASSTGIPGNLVGAPAPQGAPGSQGHPMDGSDPSSETLPDGLSDDATQGGRHPQGRKPAPAAPDVRPRLGSTPAIHLSDRRCRANGLRTRLRLCARSFLSRSQ